MTKRPKSPPPPAPDEGAPPEAIADAVARLYEPHEPIALEDLAGTATFLEVLDALPPQLRAKHGFTFAVYDASRGPLAYMPDSDWGETVPTEAAIAQRYGPGVYRVRPKKRRKGPGGGNAPEITIRIASSRDSRTPSAAAGAPGAPDRVWDLLEMVLAGSREDVHSAIAARGAAAAEGGAIPSEPPAWVNQLVEMVQSNKADEMPDWLQAILGRVTEHFLKSAGAAPPPGATP